MTYARLANQSSQESRIAFRAEPSAILATKKDLRNQKPLTGRWSIFIFIPNIGEEEPILTISYFSKGLVQPIRKPLRLVGPSNFQPPWHKKLMLFFRCQKWFVLSAFRWDGKVDLQGSGNPAQKSSGFSFWGLFCAFFWCPKWWMYFCCWAQKLFFCFFFCGRFFVSETALLLDRPTSLTPSGRVAEPFATGPETKRRQFCNGSSLSVRNFFEGKKTQRANFWFWSLQMSPLAAGVSRHPVGGPTLPFVSRICQVEELKLIGDRLHYKRVTGEGEDFLRLYRCLIFGKISEAIITENPLSKKRCVEIGICWN